MFSLVTGKAQSRGRSDRPIRTQRDSSRFREQPIASRPSKHRCEKESDSSNSHPPIMVGPLTTSQDLIEGERVFNLPLMIQQPFLREKKEPIKVDISVKLIPKPRNKEKKRKRYEAQVDDVVILSDDHKGVKNSISMEVADGKVNVLDENVEIFEAKPCDVVDSDKTDENEHITKVKDVYKVSEDSIQLEAVVDNTASKVDDKIDEKISDESQKEIKTFLADVPNDANSNAIDENAVRENKTTFPVTADDPTTTGQEEETAVCHEVTSAENVPTNIESDHNTDQGAVGVKDANDEATLDNTEDNIDG